MGRSHQKEIKVAERFLYNYQKALGIGVIDIERLQQ